MYKYATCTYLLPFFPQMANLLYSSSLYPPPQVIVKNWGGGRWVVVNSKK